MAFKRPKMLETLPKAAVPLISKCSSNILLLHLIHSRVAKDMGSTLGLPNLDQIAERFGGLVASSNRNGSKGYAHVCYAPQHSIMCGWLPLI